MNLEILEEGWDRTFLNWASIVATPLCDLYSLLRYRLVAPLDPKKFNHCESKIAEIGVRSLIVTFTAAAFTAIGAIPIFSAAAALGVTSKILKGIGFALQKNNYTHVRGRIGGKTGLPTPEQGVGSKIKILSWNLCGICGGMHYDHGGVIDWRARIDRIAQLILEEDPDILILQEVYDTALAEALIERLGPRYAHFFTHLGANTFGSVGGVMVASKCAYRQFSNTPFTNNSWSLTRTFATLDIKANPEDSAPCARIVGTHLTRDDNNKRMVQVAQLVNSVAQKTFPGSIAVAGDFNLERDKPTEGGALNGYMTPSYRGNDPTCTAELQRQWNPKIKSCDEIIDNIYLVHTSASGEKMQSAEEVKIANCHLGEAFDKFANTKTALSDHQPVITILEKTSGFTPSSDIESKRMGAQRC